MIDSSLPLLQTKLQRPRVMRGLVARPRLWEMLDRGLDKPLTLVCASPGFGKTTLVSSWLEEMATRGGAPVPAAWLSLDEHDSDLIVFLRYCVAALRTTAADACPETVTLLQSPQQPGAAFLFATLINDLARLPTRTILVLDDYAAIRSDQINELLTALVRNWPQPLHLVLLTRHNPPLPLPALHARDTITELRSQHLRFSHEETIAYLGQVLATPIDAAAVTALEQHAEGWIAGLKLATLSLDTGTSIEALVTALTSNDANVTEYLADEVYARQPRAVQAFLLRTAALDHSARRLARPWLVRRIPTGALPTASIGSCRRICLLSRSTTRMSGIASTIYSAICSGSASIELTPEQSQRPPSACRNLVCCTPPGGRGPAPCLAR